MATLLLNDLVVKKTKVTEGRLELWDTQVEGFGVRVSATGRKTFFFVYRDKGGVKRRHALGKYPEMALGDAREAAYLFKRSIEKGEKPGLVALAEAAELEKKAAVRAAKSYLDAVDDYLKIYAAQHNRKTTQDEKRWVLRNILGARWKKKAIGDVTKQDVVKVLDEYVKEGKGSGANHILSRLRTFFAWCEEREIVTANPCDKLRKPAKTTTRERVLSDVELGRIWHATARLKYPAYGALVRVLILTAQRRNEVVGMRWGEVDEQGKIWTLPKERAKNKIEQRLPLSDVVLGTIKTIAKLDDVLVFPARGNKEATFSGFSKLKSELDKLSGVEDWTLHDLRRTAATRIAKFGVAPHVIEAILNHVSGTFGGVAGIYNRHDYLDEMREALDRWAAHVSGLPNESEDMVGQAEK